MACLTVDETVAAPNKTDLQPFRVNKYSLNWVSGKVNITSVPPT